MYSRVLGFLSSRPNWDPQPLHPHGSVSPPLVPRGHHSLAGEGVGGGSNSDDGTYTVYCMYYVLSPFETEPYFSVGWGLSSTTNLR
jgi:hypothetical protein